MQNNEDMCAELAVLRQENARLREAQKERCGSKIFAHMAYALARYYTDLFYVNLQTGEFVEYRSDDESGMLVEARRAGGFFESCAQEAKLYVHPEDQDAFVGAMNQEFLVDALNRAKEFELTYRRIKDGQTFYVQMKVTRMKDDDRFIVVSVSDIDELVMKRHEEERIHEERVIYARLHAIAGNFIVVYVVNPETDHFRQFGSNGTYGQDHGLGNEGTDFFQKARKETTRNIHAADYTRFLAAFTKENILATIQNDGIFTFGYRLVIDGRLTHVKMKAAMVEESKGIRLIVGLQDIDVQVRQEEESARRIAQAEAQASIDELTGIKNRHAYTEAEKRLDREIAQQRNPSFTIAVLDVNDLKTINDTEGHQAGDQYLRDACQVICEIFKHSPVFRVGGDEFAVIAQGTDDTHIEERLWDLSVHNEEAQRTGGVVIACGVAKFEDDDCVAAVFERADQRMYEDKAAIKAKASRPT